MKDPVSGTEYPDEWAAAADPDRLELARAGLGALTSNGRVLLRGFTTGTTAAAACQAAVMSLAGDVDGVLVLTPCGLVVNVYAVGRNGEGRCAKFPGDYPSDVTAGLVFVAQAERHGSVEISYGEGIGRLTRDMGRYAKGDAAVSPSARSEIEGAARRGAQAIGAAGAKVSVMIEGGRDAARRTLNSRLGIEGGISVLGTTGLVEPWDDHLEESNLERISRSPKVVLTTGRIGLRWARLMFPEHEAVLVGSKLQNAVEAAKGEVVLCGLPALILKFVDPDVLSGTGSATVEELMATPQGGDAMRRAFQRSRAERPGLRIVLVDRQGRLLGDSS